MHLYQDYLAEIEERKTQGLHPKPIDGAELLAEIIAQIKDPSNEHRKQSLEFLIYNTLPGTTSAAGEKARFLEEIILGKSVAAEILRERGLRLGMVREELGRGSGEKHAQGRTKEPLKIDKAIIEVE